MKIKEREVITTLGDDVINQAVQFIHLGVDGYADCLIAASLVLSGEIGLGWYLPQDKGGGSLYAVNKDGRIIYTVIYHSRGSFAIYPTNKAEPGHYLFSKGVAI
jgi:hypothetical protein